MSLHDSSGLHQTVPLRGVYCTIVAQNYLPQALALYSSIRDAEPDRDLVILVVDGDRRDLELDRPHLIIEGPTVLGLPVREFETLATIYDVVELSTAVKPLFLKALLVTYEQAVYLDPDTFVVSALTELEAAVDEWGIVLTPHFLQPIEPGDAFLFQPDEPHQLINDGTEDLILYVVADNPIGESGYYPDSKKWIVRSPERTLIRSENLDYFDGEE